MEVARQERQRRRWATAPSGSRDCRRCRSLRTRRSPRTRRSSPARRTGRRPRCRAAGRRTAPTMITAVIGTMKSSKSGSMTLRPSTADSTEIAGVIMLSPKNSAAPNRPERGQQHRGAAATRAGPSPQQRDQCHDPALAVVVGAHHQRDVGQRDDDHHRPEDRRHDAVHVVRGDRHGMRVAGIEHGLDRVDRAGADVTEDDAERADHDGWAQCLLSAHGSHRCRVHACLPVISTFTRNNRALGEDHGSHGRRTRRAVRGQAGGVHRPAHQARRSGQTARRQRTPPNRSPPRASPRRRHGSSTGSRFGIGTSGRASPGSASG